MITFETQEDFEQAVMDVIKVRLGLEMEKGWDGRNHVSTRLFDWKDREIIAEDFAYTE